MKFMKKFFKPAAALLLALSCIPAVPAFAEYSFSDISDKKYEWAVGYIENMADMNLISGYEDGTYRPDNSITRLEALSLFARAMGSRSEINQKALKAANTKYGDTVAKYKLSFGSEDVEYLLYRGALKETELNSYLAEDLRNEPMPRHEAAVIITKALCAEKEATSEIMIDLEYTDAKQIPSKSSQYVYYVTKNNIMTGMGDGTFSPNSGVLRSQIAVMLSKTVDMIGLTVEELKFDGVSGSNVSFYDENGEPGLMGFNSNTRFYMDGELVQAKNIPSGVNALFTYVNNELAYVDVLSTIPDETLSGVYQGFSSQNGVVSITVRVEGENKSYELDENVKVTYNGTKATIRDFEKSDSVTVVTSDGKVKEIAGEPKETTITMATIENISIIDDGTITISHALEEYDGKSYEVASDVKVEKNGLSATLSDVYTGDTATLTLEYGVITKIKAESITKVVEGTIKSIEISNAPKITVTVKDSDVTYDVTSDVSIIINGKEGSLYDFRVGDKVSMTIESKSVKKISAAQAASVAYSKTGTVTAINSSYGFIKISYKENETTYEETVYCKDSTTKFITSEGTSKLLKDIVVGDVVSVRGTMTNGAFVASLVLIEDEK